MSSRTTTNLFSMSNPVSSSYRSVDVEELHSSEAVFHIDCSDVKQEPEHCADDEYQVDPLAIKEEQDEPYDRIEPDEDPLLMDIKQEQEEVKSEKSASDFESVSNCVIDYHINRKLIAAFKQFYMNSGKEHCDDEPHSQVPVLQREAEKTVSCNQYEYRTARVDTASHLNMHKERKHEGIRYPCDQCDYTATQASHLNRHKESKHEGKNYSCDQCD